MSKTKRLSRIICAPIRVLSRVRDFYIRSMTGCAGHMAYGGSGTSGYGYPAYAMPRSFSAASDRYGAREDDLRELMRAASQTHNRSNGVPPRSRSVVVGRIDEDSTFDFSGGNDLGVGSNLLFPRSQSYATGRRGDVLLSRGM